MSKIKCINIINGFGYVYYTDGFVDIVNQSNVTIENTMPIIYATKLEMISSSCPTQWTGRTVDDKYIYIRYRYGRLSVKIDDVEILCKNIGSRFDGTLDTEELLEHINIEMVTN